MDYSRPPAIEAVVEFRTASDVSLQKLTKTNTRLRKHYSRSEELIELSARGVAGAGAPTITQHKAGFVLTTDDGTDVIQLRRRSLIVSRRAPYSGWDYFEERISVALKAWHTAAERPTLDRIGVRYINRLDIPLDNPNQEVEEDAYLNVGLRPLPFEHQPFRGMQLRVEAPLPGGTYGFTLQSAIVESPLISHGGILLDIDVYSMVAGPLSDNDIWTRIREMRTWKNTIFEAAITDRTRNLINA